MLSKVDADLVVLPELFDTGYAFVSRREALNLASPVDKCQSVFELKKMARSKKMAIVAGIAEKDGGRLYNSAITILPDGRKRVYRKIHLFYREKYIFDPGNFPLETVKFRGGKIGVMICFDWIFPELTRSLALMGAQIICHPSNLVLPYCQHAMVTRCIENRIYCITCNRVGKEERHGSSYHFTGISRIISPSGTVLAEGGKVKEQIKAVDIDLKAANNKKVTSLNDLFEDRRREFYHI